MENTNQSSEGKTKNITLGLIISWLLGIGSAITGITFIVSKPIIGLLYLFAALILIPPVSRGIQNKLHLNLSRGVKIVIVLIIFFIIGTVMIGSSPKTELARDSVSIPTQETQPTEEVIKITAVELSTAYSDNKVAADAKYKDKMLQISGIIDSIGKDILDTPYVTLKGPQTSLFGVQCMFSKASEPNLVNLSKEQSIVLKGKMSGELIGNVIVRGCIIIEQ